MKTVDQTRFFVILAFSFLCLLQVSRGQSTYYWVGGQGEWNNPLHWATSSGGSTHPASPPNSLDHTIFDDNSFSEGDTVFVYDAPAYCNNMTWVTTRIATFYATKSINIFGSLSLSPGLQNNLSGGLYFSSALPGNTINTNGVEISGTVYFDGIGGEWTLLGSLEIFFQLYLNAGTLNTNNHSVRAMHFYSTTDYPRALNLGNSVFTCYLQSPTGGYSWIVDYNTSFSLSTGGNSHIRFTSGGFSRMKAGDGFVYDDITFLGRGQLLSNHTHYRDVVFGWNKTLSPTVNCTGRVGESSNLCLNNQFRNLMFYDHGSIYGSGNQVSQWLTFMGNGNILSGSNQFYSVEQYRYYPYPGPILQNTLTLQSLSTQSVSDTLLLSGTILCAHTVITASTTGSLAGLFTPNPVFLDYVDLRYILGINTTDPTGIGITPDTAINSLNTGNQNWVFPDNYHLPVIDSLQTVIVSPCHYSTNGEIHVFASGGLSTSQLEFMLSGPVSMGWQSSPQFTGLPKGNYTVTAREVRGLAPNTEICFLSDPVSVELTGPDEPVFLQILTQSPSCFDSCNGSLTLQVTGGVPPLEYSINWNAYSQTGTFSFDSIFIGLCSGTYTQFMVRYSGQCLYQGPQQTAILTAPDPIMILSASVTPISCQGASDGSIQILASGGTGTLTYHLMPSGTSQSSGSFTGLPPGVYSIGVTDSLGCSTTAGPWILSDPPLLQIDTEVVTNVLCNNQSNGTVKVTASGGTGAYVFTLLPDGISNGTGYFAGLSAGFYQVAVSDTKGCNDTSSWMEIQNPPALVISSETLTPVTCHNANDGSIEVQATGGSGTLTYTLQPGGLSNQTGLFTNLSPETYQVIITDQNACTLTSSDFILSNPDALVIATQAKDVNCYGGEDGCVMVSASGGVPPYSYIWTGLQTGNGNDTVCGLTAGIYIVAVTDWNGCQSGSFAVINQPEAIEVTFNTGGFPNPAPPPDYLYFAEALVSGGTLPMTHQWETGVSTELLYGVPEGIYTDTITDANGCIKVDSVYLQALACQIVATQNVQCYGASNGWALGMGLGGNTPYLYDWRRQGNPEVLSNSAFIEGLGPGTYEITITDANVISVVCEVTITEPPALGITLSPIMPLCHGDSGTVISSVTGGTPFLSTVRLYPYEYLWSNLETTPVINTPAGTYGLIVTDSLGCQATATITLNQPDKLIINELQTNPISCHNAEDGSLTVLSSGGTPPITYTLLPDGISNTTGIFTGLGEGTYSIKAEDYNLCQTQSDTVAFVNPDPILISSAVALQVSCHNLQDGSITVQATGGSGVLAYTLQPGGIFNTTGFFPNLPAGSYSVEVADTHGCSTTTQPLFIMNPDPVLLQSVIITNPDCYGEPEGSVQLTATGGTGPLTYSLHPNQGSNSSGFFPFLEAGAYLAVITDANGCSLETDTIELSYPPELQILNIQKTDMSCHDVIDGTITVSATGGTGTLSYTLYPDLVMNFSGIFTGLNEGNKYVIVKDQNQCPALSETLTIVNPEPIEIVSETYTNPLCAGSANGSITVVAAGGTEPWVFLLNPGNIPDPDGQFINLGPGVYTVTVTDTHQCPFAVSQPITITDPPVLSFITEEFTPISCHNAHDGSIEVQASGGTGPINYTLLPDNLTQTAGVFHNLGPGSYQVIAEDAQGCQISGNSFILLNPDPVEILQIVLHHPSCQGSFDGSITIFAQGGTGNLEYSIDGGIVYQALETFSNLNAGYYILSVRDANSCQAFYTGNPVQLIQPALLELSFQQTHPSCNGCYDGMITALPSGGTPPYQHSWNTGAQTASITGLGANIYYVDTLTDLNGCIRIDSTILYEPGVFEVNILSGNVSCFGGQDGWISATPAGGTPPYQYAWAKLPDPSIISTDSLLANRTAGQYSLIVTDAFGYFVADTIEITESPALDIQLLVSADSLCPESSEGWILAMVSGGSTAYNYAWNAGTYLPSRPDSLFQLTPGEYTLIITDAMGCQATASRQLYAYNSPLAACDVSNGCAQYPVFFDESSTGGGAQIIRWYYDFGDGQNQTVQPPDNPDITHIYENAETYFPALVVTNTHGCISDTSRLTLTISPLPQASFAYTQVCLGNPTQFTNTSSVSGGQIAETYWDFGDGITSGITNPSHTFATAGYHTVTLIVISNANCTDTLSQEVWVHPRPDAGFTWSPICNSLIVQFSDTSNPFGASLVQWQWEFGDGNSSSLQNPLHAYSAIGSYPVSLIVSTEAGCTDTAFSTLSLEAPWTAGFIFDTACFGDTTHFQAYVNPSGVPIQIVTWNFGDGQSGTGWNPSHAYALPGMYNVLMIVVDSGGCEQTFSGLVMVWPSPSPSFSWQSQCAGSPTLFTDLTPGTIAEWLWRFGDGSVSMLQNPQHTYSNSGVFQVSLLTTNTNGCTDSVLQSVTVPNPPIAGFQSSTSCLGSPTHFQDQSYTQLGSIHSWHWDFGDGNTSNLQNPSHTFVQSGTHLVRLLVENTTGCLDSVLNEVYVKPLPVSLFDSNAACISDTVDFSDLSTSQNGVIAQWFWNFGDGTGSNQQNPSHHYTTSGGYNVSLSVTDISGCQAQSIQTVNVFPLPVPDFIYTGPSCAGNPVQFTDISGGNGSQVTEWLWDFGDGHSSVQQHPVYTYLTSGIYSVQLKIFNAMGCTDSIVKPVFVPQSPTAAFSSLHRCYPGITHFSDLSTTPTGVIAGWQWDFGDPVSGAENYSTQQNPEHAFSAAGTYTVTLVVMNSGLCTDTVIQTLTVDAGPVAEFITSSSCFGDTTQFTDQSTAPAFPIIAWHWDFGDGNHSSQPNPSHLYGLSGQYMATLEVTDANGCEDIHTEMVPVNGLPTALFQFTNTCTGQNTYFTDFSNGAGSSIVSWNWNFGDPLSGNANQSSMQNPSHSYSATGFYPVTLTVTNANGCQGTSVQQAMIVPSPVADFEVNTPCAGQTAYFNNLSYSTGSPIQQWFWDFGDGNTSVLQFPSHTYTGPGVYQVSLAVTNANGCTHQVVHPVTIYPLPVADFTYLQPNCQGDSTYFINLSTYNGGGNAVYYWIFGDGQTSQLQTPVHFYDLPGLYTVTLTVIDSAGCYSSAVEPVNVRPSPTATFGYSPIACGQIQFTDLSYDPELAITSWYWNFGDPGSGSNNISTIQNPVHTFSQPGTYMVTLMAVNAEGCSDTAVITVTVIQPVASFTFNPQTPCTGNPVQFSDQSFSYGSTIVSRIWNFGNGNTSTQPNPVVVYENPGQYPVVLTVTDHLGCMNQVVQIVQVTGSPWVEFQTETPYCPGEEIHFTDLSATQSGAPVTSWHWQFGDGTQSSLQNPSHTYLMAGTYPVTLSIGDANGCTAEKNRNLKIYSPPNAQFTFDLQNCSQASFTDYSSSSDTLLTAWEWNFGDPASGPANFSALQHPTHTYLQPGTYTASLKIYNAAGCSDSLSQTLTITAPSASFSYGNACTGGPLQFTDLSQANGIPIQQWYWQFGDGNSSPLQNPVHTYQNPGNYLVTLTVTNLSGCQAIALQSISIPAPPVAGFSHDTPCLGLPAHFTDESYGAGNTMITSWLWNFGDGGSSTEPDPVHTYSIAGDYIVSLWVTDANGCSSTVQKIVSVFPQPQAHFNHAIPNCDTVFFYDASSAGAGSSIVLHKWNFGDPGSGMYNYSTLSNPWHLYTLPGQYQVRLIVANHYGCADTTLLPVLFDPFPQPDFTFDLSCAGDTTHFEALNTSSNIVSWDWDFGDGTTGTGQAPVHVYALPGNYPVTLVVTNNNLCTNHMTHSVSVMPTPVVDFTWSSPSCTGSEIQFVNQTLASGGTSGNWLWRFGDGTTSGLPEPVHIYNTPGVYNVTLIASNTNGCTDSLVKSITIHPKPMAAFEATPACQGMPVLFQDISLVQGSIITEWIWEFGDGTNQSGIQNPQHVYAQPGMYNVQLTVTASTGCQATTYNWAEVYTLPVANFYTEPDTLCASDTVHFSNTSIPENQIIGYMWYFGDPGSGSQDTSTFVNPYHVYNNPGTYYVTLVVTNTNECLHDTVKTIVIRPKPIVNFTFSSSCAGDTTWFTDLSYVAIPGTLTEWYWDFGDGQSSTVQNPWHIYPSTTGDTSYQVTLTVTSSWGCSQGFSQSVPVSGKPLADFTATSVCEGNVTYFTNQATTPSGVITSYFWNFGDSTYSTLPNPTHLYAQADTFMVTLTVGSSNGCFGSGTLPVVVFPLPEADFITDTVCFGDSTHFTDLSISFSGSVQSWYWNFGDPASGYQDTSTLQNPAHRYTHPGVFDVSLIAGDSHGCQSSVILPVKVDSLPIPLFAFTPATCQNTAIAFNDQSVATDSPIHWWMWRFGDGTDTLVYAPSNPDLSHIYTGQGLFYATLIVSDSNGCQDSVTHALTIHPIPEAAFTSQDTSCTSGLIYFTDHSSGNGADISSWLWDFDYPGQNYSTQQNPYFYYNQTQTTPVVMLMVEDSRGCRDTVFDTLFVKPPLQAGFTFSGSCYNDSILFSPFVIQPAGDTILQAQWSFGDGSTSGDLFPLHSYAAPGLYYIQMVAYNQNGCETIVYQSIQTEPGPLVAFEAPPAGCLDPTLFTDFSQPNSDSIVSWHWNFGDGSDSTIIAPHSSDIQHIYPEEGGIYQATLTVTNSNGCTASLTQDVIRQSCLTAGFTAISQGCSGKDMEWADLSAAGSGSVTIAQWFWDFGDGTQEIYTQRKDTVRHTYVIAGSYTVRQILTAQTGGTLYMDTAVAQVSVYPSPFADFTYSPGCINQPVQFTNHSVGQGSHITDWIWDFGDGDTSLIKNPVHIYEDQADYPVQLVVVNATGCSDTAYRLITTSQVPEIHLISSGIEFCADTITLLFGDTSALTASSRTWDFGDGTLLTSTNPFVSHTFMPGDWEITVSTTSIEGCTGSDTTRIAVHALPVARFSHQPDSAGITSAEITFLDESYSLESPIQEWKWSFGDGRDTLAVFPVHRYQDTGTFAVTQTVTDLNGCKNTYTRYVRIYPELRFFIPTAFSPNLNGRNDVFKPLGKYLKSGQYLFQVFNRWGQLLFETTNPEEGWDGRVGNEECPVGVYIWTVSLYDLYNDKEFHKGNVMLIR